MTMSFINDKGIQASYEFHQTYAKMIALEGTLEEFEYLLTAELAKPMGSESEEIFVERNTGRNKYQVNKEVLGVETDSELMKVIAQGQRETIISEINRQRNECLSTIGRLISVQDQIVESAKNHIYMINPYYKNAQVGLMKSSDEPSKPTLKVDKIFNDSEKTLIANEHKMLNHIGSSIDDV